MFGNRTASVRRRFWRILTSNRRILHVDVDAFFASVEQLDHPEYQGKPVIVGGTSERGVVSTCSYEARVFGVHSAMPMFRARQLCPDAIVVPGRYARYEELSGQIFEILTQVTDHLEKVSIDEAYLDITRLYHAPLYVARYIKKRVRKETGLTVSVGVSYNKFLAKLASEWDKPDGLHVIPPEAIPDVLRPLPIIKIHGLGARSAERLNKIGIFTVDDLLAYPEAVLTDFLGIMGKEVYQRIRGIDDREVDGGSARKSIGKERTFLEDLPERAPLLDEVRKDLEALCGMLRERHLLAASVTLKVKYSDFHQITRTRSLEHPADRKTLFWPLLEEMVRQLDLSMPVRLLGVTLSGLVPDEKRQLDFAAYLEEQDD